MLRLSYHATTTIPVEAECITPDQLVGKTLAEIGALLVQHGNRAEKLGDFFHIAGSADDGQILLEGDCSRLKLVGTSMTQGRIEIRGPIGMHVGAEMKGGEIEVHGDAADWAGAEMKGGKIHVHGNAGHLVGAAYRGGRFGMTGGVLLVDGNAGNEIGATMRRGVIAIGGNTGDFAGCGMIAGSVFIGGQPGIRTGASMKRGSIVLLNSPAALLPSFRFDCTYRPVFLRIYLRQLRQWGFAVPERACNADWKRYSGDLIALGKGEILNCEG